MSLDALVVVDLQRGTASLPTAHPVAGVIANTAELLAGFRRDRSPVAFATSTGVPPGRTSHGAGGRALPQGWSDPLPEVCAATGEVVVSRAAWSAFAGTDLDARLRGLGVTRVVLAGLATSFGIESTARAAYDLGYDVVVVSDAVSDPRAAGHDHTLGSVVPALGIVATTSEVLVQSTP